MKGREFVFNYVHLFYDKCHNCGGSNINPPDWIKIKKQQYISATKKMTNVFKTQ